MRIVKYIVQMLGMNETMDKLAMAMCIGMVVQGGWRMIMSRVGYWNLRLDVNRRKIG